MSTPAKDVSQDCIRGEGKVHVRTGYLRKSRHNKVYYAHRLAYSDANGGIPEGYHIHHLCDNKVCINPTHLIALTPDDHRALHTKPKSLETLAKKVECKLGHPLDGRNKIQRFCLTCKHEAQRRYLMRKELAL